MKIHTLKIESKYYDLILCGQKKAELRINDRDYEKGDYITFVNIDGNPYLAENIFLITDVCEYKPALKENYVMLSIERCYILSKIEIERLNKHGEWNL